MYVALINMRITNTHSKTVTLYEKNGSVKIKDAEIAKYIHQKAVFNMGIKYI